MNNNSEIRTQKNSLGYYLYCLFIHSDFEWIRRNGDTITYHKPSLLRFLNHKNYSTVTRALLRAEKAGLVIQRGLERPGWYVIKTPRLQSQYQRRTEIDKEG